MARDMMMLTYFLDTGKGLQPINQLAELKV